jgi:hypothetical protein
MAEKYVIYNGVRMDESWPAQIEESQHQPTYIINGEEHERIRYGDEEEDWGADRGPCHDCGVVKGQYHVFGLCDAERYPVCGSQAICCECHYEGDSEE